MERVNEWSEICERYSSQHSGEQNAVGLTLRGPRRGEDISVKIMSVVPGEIGLLFEGPSLKGEKILLLRPNAKLQEDFEAMAQDLRSLAEESLAEVAPSLSKTMGILYVSRKIN